MTQPDRSYRRLRCGWPYEPWACTCCGADQDRPPASTLAGLACDQCLELGRKGEPFIPLTVRPTAPARRPDERPIVAVSMLLERAAIENGDAFTLPELVERLRDRKPGEHGRARYKPPPDRLPPAVIITDNALELLAYLDHSPAANSPFWQWQVSIRDGTAWRPEARAGAVRHRYLTPRPARFGYASRGVGGRRRKQARWYMLLDPSAFCELPEGWGTLNLADLLRFGIELRDWANTNHLPLLAGASSYGARLLRDSRFAEGWRRKIPAATNARLRHHLPGNHYQLLGRRELTYPIVHKWDQAAAHHHAALLSQFPHADLLEAHGWFRRPAPQRGQRVHEPGAIPAGSRTWHQLLSQPGMFTLSVRAPDLVAIDTLSLPQFRGTTKPRWHTLTHGEIRHARDQGVELGDIWTCWTSPEQDDRLPEYALWAGGQLADNPGCRWLKPLLLASYGMLAARPSRFRNAWRYCARPDGAVGWNTARGPLIGLERATTRDREPATANVLWRAIIEAHVRQESLSFARQLRAYGLRPIAVYADAVFATAATGFGAGTIPASPPWRYEGRIHDLTFESAGRYRSREETRLPGTPRARDGLTRAHAKTQRTPA